MAKSVVDAVLDAALNYVKNNGTRLVVCKSEPTTYTQAVTTGTYMLAIKTISASDFTGPAEGDSSGRKITVNQQSGISVTTSGTATHVAVVATATTGLIIVTTCTSQVLTAGNTVTVPAWKEEIADPT